MIHYEAFQTQVDAQNKYYEIAVAYTKYRKSLGLIKFCTATGIILSSDIL